MTKDEAVQLLATPLPENDSGADTVGGYLGALLERLLDDGEAFSGKRPFGNSGWEWDLAAPFLPTDDDGDPTGAVDPVIVRIVTAVRTLFPTTTKED